MFKWLFAGTRIGKHSKLRGLLECGDDALYVDGRFHGILRSNRSVTIGRGGSVTGDIHAHDVTIIGKVKGSVVARGALRVHSAAVVDGDAYYQTLRVDHGGVIKGRTTKLDGKAKPDVEPSQHALDALGPEAMAIPGAPSPQDEAALPEATSVPALPQASEQASADTETETDESEEDAGKSKKQAVSVPPVAPDEVPSGVTSQWPAMDASAGERVLARNAKKRKSQKKKSKTKAGKSGSTTLPSSKTATELDSQRRAAGRRRGRTTNPLGAMTPPPSSVSSAVKAKEATPTPRSGVTTQANASEPEASPPDSQHDEPDEPKAASSA